MTELCKKQLREKLGDIVEFNVNMSNYSTARVGGKVDALILPRTISELKSSIRLMKKLNLKFRVVGACSNILFAFKYSSLVIISTINMRGFKVDIKNQKSNYVKENERNCRD